MDDKNINKILEKIRELTSLIMKLEIPTKYKAIFLHNIKGMYGILAEMVAYSRLKNKGYKVYISNCPYYDFKIKKDGTIFYVEVKTNIEKILKQNLNTIVQRLHLTHLEKAVIDGKVDIGKFIFYDFSTDKFYTIKEIFDKCPKLKEVVPVLYILIKEVQDEDEVYDILQNYLKNKEKDNIKRIYRFLRNLNKFI